ncbi:MAG: porin family protein [Bacteroidales bacterium]
MKTIKTKGAIIAFCLVCFAFLEGSAQFTMGPRVALNFTNFQKESKMQPGFDAGLFFRVGKRFYFQPEVNYSFKSSTFKDAVNEVETNYKLKNHYLDIPLLLGFKIVNKNNFNFRLFIGPRMGILLSKNFPTNYESGTLQWGGEAGLGIDFWRFAFDFKYDFSSNKVKNISAESATYWKQNMFVLSLGFKIFK